MIMPTQNMPMRTVIANVWQHVIGTYDGANVKIYVDGQLKDTTAYATGMNSCGGMVCFADSYDGYTGSFHYEGLMDEVKVYNYAMSSEQVNTEFNQGKVSGDNGLDWNRRFRKIRPIR